MHRLDHEPVQHRAEDGVVVVPGREPVVPGRLRRLLAVDHALVQVGGAEAPDPAGELDVVAVVHLRQVVVRAWSLGIQHPVLAALVLDLDPAFFDVDVRRAVRAHRPELDQVDVRIDLGDRVQHVQRADDVVDLGVDGVLAVDHRVRRGPLLGEVHDRVRAEVADHVVGEVGVGQVADVAADLLPGQLVPGPDPGLEGLDRHQAVDAHLEVVAAAGEVVEHGDVVADLGQMQGRRPAEVAVAAENQDFHSCSCCLRHDRRLFIGLLAAGRDGRTASCINHRTRGNNQCHATSEPSGGMTRSTRPFECDPVSGPAGSRTVYVSVDQHVFAQQGHQCQTSWTSCLPGSRAG